jgi:hypothetical protein
MPSEFCGIEGVGMKTADKMCDNDLTYTEIIKKEYTKKYGKGGFQRASLTYKMVRLLRVSDLTETYANSGAVQEMKDLLEDHSRFLKPVEDAVSILFDTPKFDPTTLFKE